MPAHVHVNAASVALVLAIFIVAKVAITTVAAHHANQSLAQAAAYVI